MSKSYEDCALKSTRVFVPLMRDTARHWTSKAEIVRVLDGRQDIEAILTGPG